MHKPKNIFVFAYYSYKDPVFVSATLNYLLHIGSKSSEFYFHLLTFEHDGYQYEAGEKQEIRDYLESHQIRWYESKWRTGGIFKPLLKIFDLLQGIRTGMKISKANDCKLIYSEGVVGGIIAHFIHFLTRKPHVIHSFEPHADAMLDGGVWTEKSWEFRLLKKFEIILARNAAGLVTGTEAYKQVIRSWGVKTEVYVVPSCVDTTIYNYQSQARNTIRSKEQIEEDEITLVYLGKFGGMYMENELFQFFENCEKQTHLRFRYWVFTGDDHDWVRAKFEKYHIDADKTMIKRLTQREVPRYLSAADMGIVAVRPFPSKRFCSPIKTGEYWACRLPIIVPAGVGDDFIQVQESRQLGESVDELEHYTLERLFPRITNQDLIHSRSISRYIKIIDDVFRLLAE